MLINIIGPDLFYVRNPVEQGTLKIPRPPRFRTFLSRFPPMNVSHVMLVANQPLSFAVTMRVAQPLTNLNSQGACVDLFFFFRKPLLALQSYLYRHKVKAEQILNDCFQIHFLKGILFVYKLLCNSVIKKNCNKCPPCSLV